MTMIEATPCDHKRMLGHQRYCSTKERDWYEKHEPWFWAQVDNGTTKWADEPAFAVNSALEWLLENTEDGEPSWEQFDVKQVLLVEIPMGTLPSYFSSRDVLIGLEEFLVWMGRHDKIDAATVQRLIRDIAACRDEFLAYFGDTDAHECFSESLQSMLARQDDPGSVWLYCLHCSRFFQAKDLRVDFLGNRQKCPFEDCGAAGLDIDIHRWDEFRNNQDPTWPSSIDELRRGMRAPV